MLPDLKLRFEDGGNDPREVRILVSKGDKALDTVFFRSSGPVLRRTADALLCLGLVPAMELGCNLDIEGEVDRALLSNAKKIQDLHRSWYSDYRPVKVSARAGDSSYPAGRGTAVFFSGGVDSSYSLAEGQQRLDGLITIIGADVAVSDRKEADRLIGAARRVAEAYGLEPVIIETNLREVFRRFIGWIEYHGSALAGTCHLLGDRFETALIASSGDETGWNCPWGSHPGLDPLFGTAGLSIEHHGLNHRLAKIERIVREPALMQDLRICNKERYNCGVCGKCTLAMRCLSVLDAFPKAPSFPPDETATGHFDVVDDATRSDLVNLRAAAVKTGRHAALVEEIDRTLARYDAMKARHRIVPMPEFWRRLKRAKHRFRYWRASLPG